VKVFGFRSGGVHKAPDGTPVHAEVRAGGTDVWLHRVAHEHALDAPQPGARAPGGLLVRVPDVDAHFAKAKAAGALLDSEPTDQFYGQREYGARDPEGHRWWFATPTPPPDPA